MTRRRRFVFAILPSVATIVLLLGVEAGLRLTGLGAPRMRKPPLMAEVAGIHEEDDDLFWKLRPNLHGIFQNVLVVTNSLGLRSPEIGAKEPGEFRILSLGESTTFGMRMANGTTYSDRLGEILQSQVAGKRIRVINAGVCAYSSFQSLKYLELRGLDLRPDLVIFYHEFNDHLPSTYRDCVPDERGLALGDRALYESNSRRMHRVLERWSAIYRWFSYRAALRSLEKMQGLAGTEGTARGVVKEKEQGRHEIVLPERVPPQERLRNLSELEDVCRRSGIRLVIMHPSYRDSTRHTCVLTDYCSRSGVPMFEAFPTLHPLGEGDTRLFFDDAHPTMAGHEALARDLARFLLERHLVPSSTE